MSGINESSEGWGNDQLAKLNKMLDEYEQSVQFKIHGGFEVDEYLSMSKAQLEALTPTQCCEVAAYLSAYSIYLQKQINRETAKSQWAESNLKLLLGRLIQEFDDYAYEAKKVQAIRSSEVATKLEKLRIISQARVTTLNYLPSRIEFFCKTLLSLQNAKAYKS